MKKNVLYVLIALMAVAAMAACTNDVGGEDLDVITPADSTQSRIVDKPGSATPY